MLWIQAVACTVESLHIISLPQHIAHLGGALGLSFQTPVCRRELNLCPVLVCAIRLPESVAAEVVVLPEALRDCLSLLEGSESSGDFLFGFTQPQLKLVCGGSLD